MIKQISESCVTQAQKQYRACNTPQSLATPETEAAKAKMVRAYTMNDLFPNDKDKIEENKDGRGKSKVNESKDLFDYVVEDWLEKDRFYEIDCTLQVEKGIGRGPRAYYYATFEVDGQRFSLSVPVIFDGKEVFGKDNSSIKAIHPYDNASYTYALTNDVSEPEPKWKICKDGKIINTASGDGYNIAKILLKMDSNVKSRIDRT